MTNDTTPAPIGADARKAAEALIRAAELDWPSTPRHRAAVLKAAADLRAALASAAQPAVPPGYALVPVEPTQEMITQCAVTYGPKRATEPCSQPHQSHPRHR